jgi:hypothetical protein
MATSVATDMAPIANLFMGASLAQVSGMLLDHLTVSQEKVSSTRRLG